MQQHIVIVGGGLAGLAAGCYARASGFRTTIVEHNIALGGVCTAWQRGSYTIDGCIHWLTGGPFEALYRELGIVPKVPLRTLELFASYRNIEHGAEIAITRDLEQLARELGELSRDDAAEVDRLVRAAVAFADMEPPLDDPPELAHLKDALARVWDLRSQIGALVHYRKPTGIWVREHLKSELLRRFFLALVPAESPMLFVLFILGYLAKGYLSRPVGGTARFRDALIASYQHLGGEARLHATVDEILVEGDRAQGVRLADGTIIPADLVVSTASTPETVLRLLAGRYGASDLHRRLEQWKLFDPIVLVSFGVATDLRGVPPTLVIDDGAPFEIGGFPNERLYLRIYNDDPSFAPPGHTVVQAMLTSSYDWWATRGTAYSLAKDSIAEEVLARLEVHLPHVSANVRIVDVATPLTYWNMARAWRGAYEGWLPRSESFFGHLKKKLPGLDGLYLAGQWVEPGGGVPTAVMSGRHVVQLLCADLDRAFQVPAWQTSAPSSRALETRASAT
jgi:phytoene dehydrogenase-like protein